jgi:hypothetical protein
MDTRLKDQWLAQVDHVLYRCCAVRVGYFQRMNALRLADHNMGSDVCPALSPSQNVILIWLFGDPGHLFVSPPERHRVI